MSKVIVELFDGVFMARGFVPKDRFLESARQDYGNAPEDCDEDSWESWATEEDVEYQYWLQVDIADKKAEVYVEVESSKPGAFETTVLVIDDDLDSDYCGDCYY